MFLPDDKGISPIAFSASNPCFFPIFKFIASVVPDPALVEGDLLLTRSIKSPPVTALKAALSHKNSSAVELILQKNEARRKKYVLWISQHSPILSKLNKNLIENIIKYS